jgi:DNA-binding SARP family transcriptional activator
VLDFQFLGWDVWSHARAGRAEAARESLKRMDVYAGRGRMMDAFRHLCVCAVSIQEGDFPGAVEEGLRALQFGQDTNSLLEKSGPHFALAHAYARLEKTQIAEEHCRQARAIVDGMQSKIGIFFCAFAETVIWMRRGNRAAALRGLPELIGLAREMNAVTPPWCPRDDAAALYALALDADIETDYVRQVIRKTHLLPNEQIVSDKWPWRIRVYTLGRLAVFVDDKGLNLADRSQKRPLELLRAIVICGGQGVTTQRLTQMLWPNVDKRSANHALDTLLYRLRRLLGENCIERHKTLHTLNPRYCWLDALALERRTDVLHGAGSTQYVDQSFLDYYRGPFLDGSDSPAVLLRRELLRSKLSRAIKLVADDLETREDYAAMVALYQKAVETDPLVEAFHYGLMRSHYRLRHLADALAAYRRCRTIFRSVLDTEPSTSTKTLYEYIRAESADLPHQ